MYTEIFEISRYVVKVGELYTSIKKDWNLKKSFSN